MEATLRGFLIAGLILSNGHVGAQALRTATATASTVNGFVVGATITDGGAGYSFPPQVTFVGVGTGAGAYSIVSNGAVIQIAITNTGIGYTSVPTVVISSPSSSHYSFRSGGAYVTVPDSASLRSTTNQLTVECWFSRAASQGDWNAMVSKESTSYSLNSYFLGCAANTLWPIVDTSPTIFNGGLSSKDGNPAFPGWHHLAMQYNRTNYTVWLDGSSIYSSNSAAQIIIGSNPLSIGCQASGFRVFDGYIAEVRISKTLRYTAAFTPQARFTSDTNTVALYHFDEGSGAVVHDASSNGNDGVIQGASAWSSNVPSVCSGIVNLRKAIYVDFSNLAVGGTYQLQFCTNLTGGAWNNFGAAFSATNSSMSVSNYWNVSDWNQLYFRLSQ